MNAPESNTVPSARVALQNEFSTAVPEAYRETVETLRPALRQAAMDVYGRPTLNTMHSIQCTNMVAAIISELKDEFSEVPIDYLEIGSFQGASMTTIGSLINRLARPGRLVSVDPYFDEGYVETPPGGVRVGRKMSTPATMQLAQSYYQRTGIDVEVRRMTSEKALFQMVNSAERFHFIYIDGKHEQLAPMQDVALALRCLQPGGRLMLDDVNWPDVRPIYDLCVRHLDLRIEGFEKACFRVADPVGVL